MTNTGVRTIILAACALAFAACSSSNNEPVDGAVFGKDGGTAGAAAGTTGTGGTAGSKADGGAAGADAGETDADAATTDGGGPDADGGASTPPALGVQVDRMGRPAINTAITDPFDGNATAHEAKQDSFNALAPSTAMTFEAAFEANLAVFDSLDLVCGNQFAANSAKTDPTRYKPLADVLLDDQLYVDTSSGTCAVYLGVEANATTIIPNTDCGGRTLTEDVIDESYSVLATGMLTGVTDGIAADDKATSATFPYLAAPN